MKQIHFIKNLLKSLVLAGLLTACNNEQAIAPNETKSVVKNEQNAKLTSLTRLVKEGDYSILYIKNGRFSGKISKIYSGPSHNYNYEYTYDDNNPSGNLWVSKKQYKKTTNAFVQEWKYKVINGFCVSSESVATNDNYVYTYNAQALLDEVKLYHNGVASGSWKYSYVYNAATSAHRLQKVTSISSISEPMFETTFTYYSTTSKYLWNPVDVGMYTEHGNIERYLPIFGKFSDVLVETIIETSLQNPAASPYNKKFTYVTNGDGLVTTRIRLTASASQTTCLSYSDNWQGI